MSTEVIEEVDLFNETPDVKQAIEKEVSPVEDAKTFEVPEKFQGKSFEDLVESYTNLEKEMGRKSNEVGELRKLTDDILKQQVSHSQAAPAEEIINDDIGLDDLFEDPKATIDKALSSNPRIASLEARMNQEAQKASHQELLSRHSDADEVVASSEFSDWVQASPTRLKNLQAAHQDYDVEAADDLLTVFKTTRKITTEEATEARDTIAAEGLKKASTEKGSVAVVKKPAFKRADLIRLKIQDPHRYASMSDEIKQAYAAGRVK